MQVLCMHILFECESGLIMAQPIIKCCNAPKHMICLNITLTSSYTYVCTYMDKIKSHNGPIEEHIEVIRILIKWIQYKRSIYFIKCLHHSIHKDDTFNIMRKHLFQHMDPSHLPLTMNNISCKSAVPPPLLKRLVCIKYMVWHTTWNLIFRFFVNS